MFSPINQGYYLHISKGFWEPCLSFIHKLLWCPYIKVTVRANPALSSELQCSQWQWNQYCTSTQRRGELDEERVYRYMKPSPIGASCVAAAREWVTWQGWDSGYRRVRLEAWGVPLTVTSQSLPAWGIEVPSSSSRAAQSTVCYLSCIPGVGSI